MFVNMKLIKKAVAESYDMPVDLLDGSDHLPESVEPRHVAMFVARKLLKRLSIEQIAIRMNRDHSTVVIAVRGIAARMAKEPGLIARVAEIERLIAVMSAAEYSFGPALKRGTFSTPLVNLPVATSRAIG